MRCLFTCTKDLIKIYALLSHCTDTTELTRAPVTNHIQTELNRIYIPISFNVDFNYVVVSTKEIGLEVNSDKTKYMIMSRDQNAG